MHGPWATGTGVPQFVRLQLTTFGPLVLRPACSLHSFWGLPCLVPASACLPACLRPTHPPTPSGFHRYECRCNVIVIKGQWSSNWQKKVAGFVFLMFW